MKKKSINSAYLYSPYKKKSTKVIVYYDAADKRRSQTRVLFKQLRLEHDLIHFIWVFGMTIFGLKELHCSKMAKSCIILLRQLDHFGLSMVVRDANLVRFLITLLLSITMHKRLHMR